MSRTLNRPENFRNRELSWLSFNSRILNEAKDKTNPLFERLKFLAITASNLDEFFMVRVGSLVDMKDADYKKKDIAGMTVTDQLQAITEEAHKFVDTQYQTFLQVYSALNAEGISMITDAGELDSKELDYLDKYFREEVFPVLTPMAVDSSRPFPLVRNKSLNIGALLKKDAEGTDKKKKKTEEVFATVQVPGVLPRVIFLPGGSRFMFLEQLIQMNLKKLFMNYEILCSYPYRITRNADLSIDEEEAEDLLKEIEKQIKKRQWGQTIRLETSKGADKKFIDFLKKELQISSSEVFSVTGPLDLTVLMKVIKIEGYDQLRSKSYTPQPSPQIDPSLSIFDNIKKHDILLHHPYESFDPVVDFVKQAAVDPDVLAIKQTLYRVSGNSPIIAALAKAADNGKQVSVLVELKARFDEENNINWARMLEKAGCHVIYGLVGLKTHSKITLVVRKEEEGIVRYVHLGTGNYNDATAKLYTDIGLLTCRQLIGEDATAVFNMLSGYSEPLSWNRLILAPLWMRDRFLKLIARETKHAKDGRIGHITAKMNSLCDEEIITALYEASCAGVTIDLIIRGICCLKTGIPGVSENIRVRSIVGDFLEHARIYSFYNDGDEEIYCASADWMPRNLDRRVEIMYPIEEPALKDRIRHILDVQLNDNVKATMLQPDGTYAKESRRGKSPVIAQQQFCDEAIAAKKEAKEAEKENRVFRPRINPNE